MPHHQMLFVAISIPSHRGLPPPSRMHTILFKCYLPLGCLILVPRTQRRRRPFLLLVICVSNNNLTPQLLRTPVSFSTTCPVIALLSHLVYFWSCVRITTFYWAYLWTYT